MDFQEVPFKKGYTTNTIFIEWLEKRGHFDKYIVKYRAKGNGDEFLVVRTSNRNIQISNLESGSLYEIKIYVEDSSGDEILLFKTEVTTSSSIASQLLNNSDKICDKPALYRVRPAKSTKIDEDIHVHEYFSAAIKTHERTLLLVGASGSGKSTLVDAIINYATDVSFADKFRFKITDESGKKSIQKPEDIVCHKIRWQDGSNVGFDLNVIEMPGFESGNNVILYKNLITLFQSIGYISAACLVVSSFSRLTAEQRSIFNNILSIFGKDIKYVIPLITFDDGGEMNALSSLKAAKVPYDERNHFRFNNSQLLSGNEQVEIWNRRQDTMRDLFGRPTVFVNYSLQITIEVLKSRTKLLMYLREARTYKQDIESMDNIINDYNLIKDRQQQTPKMQEIRQDADKICINCNTCKQTCVFDCSLAIRLFWYFVCVFENVWAYLFCICSLFPCCSRIFRCSCKRACCCCIKCIHICLGCNCSCSFAHHNKEYGRYNDDTRDRSRNTPDGKSISSCKIENNSKEVEMKDNKDKLINKFVETFENISKHADFLKRNALFEELPTEIENFRKYKTKLESSSVIKTLY